MKKHLPAASKTAKDSITGGTLASFFIREKNGKDDGRDIQVYPAQAKIFKQDTPSDTVYLVEQGVVKLVRVASNGSQVIIGLRHRNWLIGAPAVLLDKPYSFTAVTLFPSILHAIPARVFLKLATTNRQFSTQLHQLLCKEIFIHMRNVESVCCMSAEDRVKRFLCELIADQVPHGSKRAVFSLPLTNLELAELIAVTPEHLCRVLKGMQRKGIIKRDRSTLIVENPMELLQSAAIC